ncbi:tRNA (guanosine(37)-N1)-methyltransferase TrmD [Spiroplasma endosymbiont of Amphibalanus improvisus]|uniref:tRNA (guanosine(37)-N1)-methyltransferase TrmD n=1 Tax=Spiroplasma endosymbiont of Amphibalanus improvisus TaxID=3066327 RepID=UPI00313C88A4
MNIKILTLFPQMFNDFQNTSIIAKALKNQKLNLELIDIRDFADNKFKQVDDYPAGGGQGMVLKVDVIYKAIQSVKTDDALVVLLSPKGKVWDQRKAYTWSKKYKTIILICGHYEGFDARISNYCDLEVSIGDYILTGGELASMVIIDSVARLLPGVIKTESHLNESFNNDLLDYDVYTKPVVFDNKIIPEVLLSGHHKNIDDWREKSRIYNTYSKRKDLLKKAQLNLQQKNFLNIIKKDCKEEEN